MDKDITERVRARLKEREMTQADLARETDYSHQYISLVLDGLRGKVPRVWQSILSALDLRLVVVPKDAEVIIREKAAEVEDDDR